MRARARVWKMLLKRLQRLPEAALRAQLRLARHCDERWVATSTGQKPGARRTCSHIHRGVATSSTSEEVVVVSGLPRGNPPRSLAFKLKELLGLRATPTLLQRPATSEALLLTHSDADARTVRRVCATAAGRAAARQPRPSRRPAQLGLGTKIELSLRTVSTAGDLLGDPIDKRPWGAYVLRRSKDSGLAAGPRDTPSPTVDAGATAERVLRRGGTDPKGLTVALGGFDDHFEEGVYLCAGCYSPLYTSQMKFSCGCGWPVSGCLSPRAAGCLCCLDRSCCLDLALKVSFWPLSFVLVLVCSPLKSAVTKLPMK